MGLVFTGWTLGYDPATDGAATLLTGGGVYAVWAWRRRSRGGEYCYEVCTVASVSNWQPAKRMVPTLCAVGNLIAREAVQATGQTRINVWREGIYTFINPKTAIRLGIIAGEITGPMVRYSNGRTVRDTQPPKWRAALLGLPARTKRDAAKAASLKHMPLRLLGLADALTAVAQGFGVDESVLDHITDSAGVAEYGSRYGGEAT